MSTIRDTATRCIIWSTKKIILLKGFTSPNLKSLILGLSPSMNKCMIEMINAKKKKFHWNDRAQDNTNTIRICQYNFFELKPFFFLSSDHSLVWKIKSAKKCANSCNISNLLISMTKQFCFLPHIQIFVLPFR